MRFVPVLLLATTAFAQTATQIEKDIRTLADPKMEGRGSRRSTSPIAKRSP